MASAGGGKNGGSGGAAGGSGGDGGAGCGGGADAPKRIERRTSAVTQAANPKMGKASRKRRAPVEKPAANLSYEQMSVPDLKEACKSAGICRRGKTRRLDLIELLRSRSS